MNMMGKKIVTKEEYAKVQAQEIKKYIRSELQEIIDVATVDFNDLSSVVTKITKFLDENAKDIENIDTIEELVNSNKLSAEELRKHFNDSLKELRSEIIEIIKDSIQELKESNESLKKEIAKSQEIDYSELCAIFASELNG